MYLLDTCVLSELIKKEPSKKVTRWISERDESLLFVSALTFGEIIKGVEKLTDSARKKKLEHWIQEYLIPRFSSRSLSIDQQVSLQWGLLLAKSEKKGRILPTIDSLIAATAIRHRLSVVTRNTIDFEGLQLSLINPWESE